MVENFYSWLAGFVDGDGSIFITLRETQNKPKKKGYVSKSSPYLAINAGLVVTQRSDYRWVNEYIQKETGCGKIYLSGNYGASYSKSIWQTTKMNDTIFVLESLLPYLVIKKEQAKKTIVCLKRWIESRQPEKMRGNGDRIRKRSMVLEIVDIATHLNSNMRTSSRFRGYKDFAYWKPLIEQWYPE